MSINRRKITRNRQPQSPVSIDWSNPITRGLVDVIDLRGIPCSLILGTPYSIWGVTPSFGRVTPFGYGIENNTTGIGGVYFERQDSAYAQGTVTHVAVGAWDDWAATGQDCVFSASSAVANGSVDSFNVRMTDPTTISTSGAGSWSNQTLRGGGLGVFVAGAGGGEFGRAYWRGAQVSVLNFAVTLPAQSTSKLALFANRTLATNISTRGRYLLHLVYNRRLTLAETLSISANPWQVFSPIQQEFSIQGGILVPTLSLPGYTNLTQTTIRPRVTLTF